MNTPRVVVTGSAGQLGRALRDVSANRWSITGLDLPEVDICSWSTVSERIFAAQPELVIHTAAATDVDRCEREPDWAFAVNALGTRNVARAAAAVGAQLIYISTNYVFEGLQENPYHEFDRPNPISFYGASKLAGELEATTATVNCWVVRTAMLYAREGRNFVNTMLRLMAERDQLTVVSDQTGNPTYASDLATAIVEMVERAPPGIYHAVNDGVASWYEWASEIARMRGIQVDVLPIPARDYVRDAAPPANGALLSLALPIYGISLPDWRDALARALAE